MSWLSCWASWGPCGTRWRHCSRGKPCPSGGGISSGRPRAWSTRRKPCSDANVTIQKLPRTSYLPVASSVPGIQGKYPTERSRPVGPPIAFVLWRTFMAPATDARRRNENGSDDILLVDADLSPDLAWLVERVRQNKQPWVVVATAALEAWEQRQPA